MKIVNSTSLLVTAAFAVALTGCATGSKTAAPAPRPAPIAVAPAPAPAPVMAPAPPPPPPVFVVEDVNFDFDKSTLRPSATATLDQVVAGLRQQPGIRYEVTGFTDSTGSDAYNQGLSERRAIAVRDYLVSHGIDAGQLSTNGNGEANAVASNATREGRARNRRVEVRPFS